ncbi:MAG TPA: diguanylate cyclase [Novosphingobium sp.]|nr:diguanylate cyclase [Novosphingobium sp.]
MSAVRLPTIREMLGRVHLRLILFAVLLAAASLMLSGGLVIRSYAQRNLDLVARTVAYTVEPAVVFDDRQAIVDGIVSVSDGGMASQVEVFDPAGRLIAHWQNPRVSLPQWLLQSGNELLWRRPAVAPLIHSGTRIGEVRITGNPEGLLRFALAGAIIALTTLALTVIATRILARRLQRDVIGPLEHVAEVAHAVRTERSFDRRVPVAGIAEIDRFGQDFNALLAELQGWHATMTRENAELAERVLLDPLTGLGNRAAFEAALPRAVTAAVTASQSFAVLYCDLDQFKAINDTHGHVAGDAVLVAVARRMQAVLRQQDQAFRLGGDEFAVLLAPVDADETACRVAARLGQAMVPPIDLPGGQAICTGLSVGIATYPDDGLAPEELLRRADRAMYSEKRARNHNNNGGQ